MKPGVREWNWDLINSIFQVDEALLIKCIPLSSTDVEDDLVWGGEHSGVYSMRSGYKLLIDSNLSAPLERMLYKQI